MEGPQRRSETARIYLWIGSVVLLLNAGVVLFLIFGTRPSSCTIRVVQSEVIDGLFHFAYESSFTANSMTQEWESVDGEERFIGWSGGTVAYDRFVTKTLANMYGGRPKWSARMIGVPAGAVEILLPKMGEVVALKPGDSFVRAQFKDKEGRVIKWITRVVEVTALPDPVADH